MYNLFMLKVYKIRLKIINDLRQLIGRIDLLIGVLRHELIGRLEQHLIARLIHHLLVLLIVIRLA